MKTNKHPKFTKKGAEPIKSDADETKHKKVSKDRSSKRRLSIYDDFEDDLDDLDFNADNYMFDGEDEDEE